MYITNFIAKPEDLATREFAFTPYQSEQIAQAQALGLKLKAQVLLCEVGTHLLDLETLY